jgi:hypothetical protein
MTATAHALVGGAIATATIHNPVLGLTLAAASHPFLDMVPHWDFGWGWRDKSKLHFLSESFFDLLLGLFLSYILFGRFINPVYFLAVIFASLFLDFLIVPYWFLKWKFPPFSTVYKFQHAINSKAKLPWGVLNQVITVVGVILALRIFH